MLFDHEVMLEGKTERMFSESEKVVNWFLKQEEISSLDMITNLSSKDFKMIQKTLKLYKSTKELAITQAKAIDRLNNQVVVLIEANDRLSDKMDEMMEKLERIDERGKMVLVKRDEEN